MQGKKNNLFNLISVLNRLGKKKLFYKKKISHFLVQQVIISIIDSQVKFRRIYKNLVIVIWNILKDYNTIKKKKNYLIKKKKVKFIRNSKIFF
jgi:hypothetical protein